MAQRDLLVWNSTAGQIQVTQTGDTAILQKDLDLVGNLTVSGTVDGRNISVDGTKLDLLTVTGPLDLDTLSVDVSNIEVKTDHLTVTAATDLDTMRTKVDYLTVTGAVDLDAISAAVGGVTNVVVLMGTTNLAGNLFPVSTKAGESWIVTADASIGGTDYFIGDRIIALQDSASTTLPSHWYQDRYTDSVTDVNGKTGSITLVEADISDLQSYLLATDIDTIGKLNILVGESVVTVDQIDTLAELNTLITDATLDTTSDPRDPNAHTHTAAEISGAASVNTGVTAFATGGQGSATQLLEGYNVITTCASDGDSVLAPSASAGLVFDVTNQGAQNADLFPTIADNFSGYAANEAIVLEPGDTIRCWAIDNTTWVIIGGIGAFVPGSAESVYTYVTSASDFPAAVDGLITITSGSYLLDGNIDLNGDRILVTGKATIAGTSSETAFLTSTGLAVDTALITALDSIPMQNLTIHDVDMAFNIDDSLALGTLAVDWYALNVDTVTKIGRIGTVSNFLWLNSAWLSSQGLRFDGTVGTIGIQGSLLLGDGSAANLVELESTAVVDRRFKLTDSSVIAFGSTQGVVVDAAATVPVEGLILRDLNFSGGGTYLSGVTAADDEARFEGNRGISNTISLGVMFMHGNATVTTISGVDTPTKVLGTTTVGSAGQKFTHTDNRLTYNGALTNYFQVHAVASVTGSSSKVAGFYVAVNGVAISESEMYATTNTGGRAESIGIQHVVELQTGDYVEIWIENATDSTNFTVEDLNVHITNLSP
jgi:hypothetical protein